MKPGSILIWAAKRLNSVFAMNKRGKWLGSISTVLVSSKSKGLYCNCFDFFFTFLIKVFNSFKKFEHGIFIGFRN